MIFLGILLGSALFISSVAAWFSIIGLMAIFTGSSTAIAVMGVALEVGKLVTASWLYRFWNKAAYLMKTYFVIAVVVLSFITSIGIFGYLTRAHVEGISSLSGGKEEIALIDNSIQFEEQSVVTLTRALEQMDAAVEGLIANERLSTSSGAVSVRNRQRAERAEVVRQINETNKNVLELKKQRIEANSGQRTLENEIGPIKYFAQLVYSNDDVDTIERAVRFLTLTLVFVFDPLAILLVVAANIQYRAWKEENEEKPKEMPIIETPEKEPEITPETPETEIETSKITTWSPASGWNLASVEDVKNSGGNNYLLVDKKNIDEL